MCLDISHRRHAKVGADGFPLPFVTDRPILVWKWLESFAPDSPILRRNPDAFAKSPFRNYPYVSGKLETAEMCISTGDGWWGDVKYQVHDGLHAYRRTADWMTTDEVYPAVIPAGSKVYISTDVENKEIVSDNLIVYKTLAELEAVHGKTGPNVGVKRAMDTFLKVAE